MPDPTLPGFDPPDPHHLARRTDPSTSHEAAASLTAIKITATRRAILDTLRKAPDGLSDEQIADAYTGPPASPSGLRTRRSELCEAGLVVAAGWTYTRSGRRTIVWKVATGGDVAAMVHQAVTAPSSNGDELQQPCPQERV